MWILKVVLLLGALAFEQSEAGCGDCSENSGAACVGISTFQICVGNEAQTKQNFTCPNEGEVCTTLGKICMDLSSGSSVKAVCSGESKCDNCVGRTDLEFTCSSSTTFTRCSGQELSSEKGECPENLFCVPGENPCQDRCAYEQVLGDTCDREAETTDPTPTPSTPTPTPSTPTPTPSTPTPTPSTPTPTPSTPTPTPSTPTPTPSTPTPTPSTPTPTPSTPTPTPSTPTPTPSTPTPTPSTPIPTPSTLNPTPGPSEPTPTPSIPTPNPSTPSPTPGPSDPSITPDPGPTASPNPPGSSDPSVTPEPPISTQSTPSPSTPSPSTPTPSTPTTQTPTESTPTVEMSVCLSKNSAIGRFPYTNDTKCINYVNCFMRNNVYTALPLTCPTGLRFNRDIQSCQEGIPAWCT